MVNNTSRPRTLETSTVKSMASPRSAAKTNDSSTKPRARKPPSRVPRPTNNPVQTSPTAVAVQRTMPNTTSIVGAGGLWPSNKPTTATATSSPLRRPLRMRYAEAKRRRPDCALLTGAKLNRGVIWVAGPCRTGRHALLNLRRAEEKKKKPFARGRNPPPPKHRRSTPKRQRTRSNRRRWVLPPQRVPTRAA